MTIKDIVIINGQSGINIKKCLDNIDIEIIASKTQIDPLMTAFAQKKNFLDVLAKPPREQEELWKKAFDKYLAELPVPKEG